MGVHAAPFEGPQPLSPSPSAALRLAAAKMTGANRRALEAEMTVQYCAGNPLLAATTCGWGRQTVAVGLAERRPGLRCLGAQAACSGRKRWAEPSPEVAAALGRLAAAHVQQAPTLLTTLAYTRLTAKAALSALRAQGYSEEQGPSLRTMDEVLKRLGFRLRKVVQAKPQKKIAETDALLANMEKKTTRPPPRQASNA